MPDKPNIASYEVTTTEDRIYALVGIFFRAQELYERGMHVDDPTIQAEALHIMNEAERVVELVLSGDIATNN